MEENHIDFCSEEKFRIACEDFLEEFKARLDRKNSNQKMLNLSFAVLWVFLNKIVENNFESVTREEIELSLAREFLAIFEESDWAVFSLERETSLLIVPMLVNFFIKHGVMSSQFNEVFAYMLDQALCAHALRVTNFDLQRISLKKETRFVVLLISFLAQLITEFGELVDCGVRFRNRMLSDLTMADSLKDWRKRNVTEAKYKPSQGVFDISLYAVVLLYTLF